MIDLQTAQYGVLATSVTLLLAQVFTRDKHLAHVLFGLFCASVSFSVVYKLSGDSVGIYKYLIGMGACATCNVYWLLVRSLFRDKNPIALPHIIFAVVVALLIMARQGQRLLDSVWGLDPSLNHFTMGVLGELIVMLSSVVLIMSCWETIRGFNQATLVQKVQRMLFLGMFITAVAICKIVEIISPATLQYAVAFVTMGVLVGSQLLMTWIVKTQRQVEQKLQTLSEQQLENERLEDEAISAQIQSWLIDHKQFLQPNLKVADVARELDKPEFKISRVLRRQFDAKNFNQFVNELRIEHAKALLTDAEKQQWSVLVVGLESGFASVGPFTRAFKSITGYTPNQYRKEFC